MQMPHEMRMDCLYLKYEDLNIWLIEWVNSWERKNEDLQFKKGVNSWTYNLVVILKGGSLIIFLGNSFLKKTMMVMNIKMMLNKTS